MREAVIVAAARTAVGKGKKGSLRDTRPEEFTAPVLREALSRAPGFAPEELDDILLGCAMPEGEQGFNIARIAALLAGLPESVPAATLNRFCSSGSQTVAWAADAIRSGSCDTVLAGGLESMSQVAMGGNKLVAGAAALAKNPHIYTGMGATAEIVARRYAISREEQDAFALASHQKACAALEAGKFRDEIVPLKVRTFDGGRWRDASFDTDEGPRADTTLEGLAKLKPAFDPKGTVTAGNTSQVSDGAAALLVMSEESAHRRGLPPLAYIRGWAAAGVAPEVMGIGPVAAVPKLLKKVGLTLDEVDLVELNEAFASQSLACIRELKLDPEKVNVNGGAIALGHPLGATGAVLSVKLIHELRRRNARRGIVTMCIGGGMGFAYLLERP